MLQPQPRQVLRHRQGVGILYVSVAQTPTSVMLDYELCRAECEKMILEPPLKTSIIRPLYVVGPGHYWPFSFLPFFKMLELIPKTSAKAKALRLVYLKQMLDALVNAVENLPAERVRFFEIEYIKSVKM